MFFVDQAGSGISRDPPCVSVTFAAGAMTCVWALEFGCELKIK